MNKVELMGRLTKEPEVRWTGSGEAQTCVARFTLAVDRRGKREEGKQNADFISCCCFGRTAQFAEKYLAKGLSIALIGRIQTGSYTNKDGVKVYTTDVVAEEIYFAEKKREEKAPDADGFIDEDLPFNM